jgi:hypothetical protein
MAQRRDPGAGDSTSLVRVDRGEPMELDSVSLGMQENGVLDASNRCEV